MDAAAYRTIGGSLSTPIPHPDRNTGRESSMKPNTNASRTPAFSSNTTRPHAASFRMAGISALVMMAAPPVQAAAPPQPANPQFDHIPFEEIWRHATLYKDKTNPILQEFKLRGRYQGQYWDVDADDASQSDWEDRRARIGFDAKLLEEQLELRADFQSNNGFNDIYDGLVDAYLLWRPSKTLAITLGKTKTLIGHYDWLESTNTQPTFERSQIFNQLGVNRATALTAEGSHEAFMWRAGIYSNDTPSNTGGSGAFGDGEFGDLNGGHAFSIGAGYDFSKTTGLDKTELRIDWLHSEREPGDLVLGRYDDILSATLLLRHEASALVIEGFHASGGDGLDSDVYGFFIQPTYDLLPGQLQLVGRYSYANSSGPLGVIAQRRYESTVAGNGGRGDSYHSIYGGAQYFIHGDKLKLMAGAEWATLNGNGEAYDGITLLTGVRLSF